MKKLFVVYRNNDLFNRFIPLLLSLVPKGVEVIKLVFLQGTETEQIKESLKKLLSDITSPVFYLSDDTCNKHSKIGEYLNQEFENAETAGLKRLLSLDWAMKKEVEVITSSTSFEETFKKISSAIICKPSEVYIVKNNLTDHLYGFSDKEEFQGLCNNPSGFYEKLENITKNIYPKSKIIFVEGYKDALDKGGNKKEALIIADRHTGILSNSFSLENWNAQAKLFLLPFENVLSHLDGTELFNEDFNVERIYSSIMEGESFE